MPLCAVPPAALAVPGSAPQTPSHPGKRQCLHLALLFLAHPSPSRASAHLRGPIARGKAPPSECYFISGRAEERAVPVSAGRAVQVPSLQSRRFFQFAGTRCTAKAFALQVAPSTELCQCEQPNTTQSPQHSPTETIGLSPLGLVALWGLFLKWPQRVTSNSKFPIFLHFCLGWFVPVVLGCH